MTSSLSSVEATELAQSVRAACERLATPERVRNIAYEGGGFDRELWSVLCEQIGVVSMGLPEDAGGAGYGVSALGVVGLELGRALAPVPFVATAVLAMGVLADLGDRDRAAALADGSRTATVVIDSQNSDLTATARDGGWRMDGTARHVLHGADADDLIVIVDTGDGLSAFAVERAAAGVDSAPQRVLDPTRPMATITMTGATAQPLGPAARAVSRNTMRAMAVLSAEQVGAHEAVLDIAAEYARTREQFGRPIGSFQAVKHRAADMLVALEWSRSASLAALEAIDTDSDDAGWLTSLAKAVCSEGLREASHANLQIHGGIGFTWEDSAHLYLRRARTDEVLFGAPGEHWDRVGTDAKIY